MRLALYTGMRRGEMFKLKWNDIDFQRGFIAIKNPKGGVSQKIPLNEQARQVLENHPETEGKENVFLRPDGEPFTDIRRRVNPIKEAAGIPADFPRLAWFKAYIRFNACFKSGKLIYIQCKSY